MIKLYLKDAMMNPKIDFKNYTVNGFKKIKMSIKKGLVPIELEK